MAPEPAKRELILQTAAKLFASTPFHEVRLDTIAAKSKLGKGTIYLYFQSKEELYLALKMDGMDRILREIREGSSPETDAWDELGRLVGILLGFARKNPHMYAMIRAGIGMDTASVDAKRDEIAAEFESCIRRGIRAGNFADTHPELTAQYVLSFIRVALLYAPRSFSEKRLHQHMMHVLASGIVIPRSNRPKLAGKSTKGRK